MQRCFEASSRIEEGDCQLDSYIIDSIWTKSPTSTNQSCSNPESVIKSDQYLSSQPKGERPHSSAYSSGETMWVHPDIVESQQWTTITNRKYKGKAKASSSNVVSYTSETEKDVASLTSSGDEESAFVADAGTPPISKT